MIIVFLIGKICLIEKKNVNNYNRYYEGGVSSVYCWDLDDGFAACILIKKSKLFLFCEIFFFLTTKSFFFFSQINSPRSIQEGTTNEGNMGFHSRRRSS